MLTSFAEELDMRRIFPAVIACLVAVGPVCADTRETALKNLARYQQYAGDPVDSFDMWELYQWQTLGPDYLAVWSAVNKVYMLKVSQPCANIESANAISVTSEMAHKVSIQFDFVRFDEQHCKIVEIRPIDYKAMLKAGQDEKSRK
jgi:Family of unknown function (DUF6491)